MEADEHFLDLEDGEALSNRYDIFFDSNSSHYINFDADTIRDFYNKPNEQKSDAIRNAFDKIKTLITKELLPSFLHYHGVFVFPSIAR